MLLLKLLSNRFITSGASLGDELTLLLHLFPMVVRRYIKEVTLNFHTYLCNAWQNAST